MTQLIATRGLPASGKTTWARQWVAMRPDIRARVNRDDLREQLFGPIDPSYYAAPDLHEREKTISKAEEAMVTALIRADKDVVVDATHIRARYLKRWVALAEKLGAEFVLTDFTDVPVDVCIARDADRMENGERGVGHDVIRDMAGRLASQKGKLDLAVPAPDPYVYEPGLHLDKAWIFDIDGTLALMNGRSPYDTARCGEDTLCSVVAHMADYLSEIYKIVIMSGREESYRDITEEWLARHEIEYDDLFMREPGDTREDSIIKLELFREHVAPVYEVLGVFDDRDRVVAMWRRIGLQCFQVAPGDF